MPSDQQLLAIVAVINAVGNLIALIIHALRVPYRESAAREQTMAIDAVTRAQHERAVRAPFHVSPPDAGSSFEVPGQPVGGPREHV